MKTEGISPKVKLPAIVLGVVGVVLVGASYLVDGLEGVREVGIGLVAASPLGALIGYNSAPGEVTFTGDNLAGGVEQGSQKATVIEQGQLEV